MIFVGYINTQIHFGESITFWLLFFVIFKDADLFECGCASLGY